MRTALFIIARLKSTRLPKKVTRPIHGRPMIGHMLDRLRLAERPEQIILCTSPVAEDDPLEAFAEAEGIACFRGDPDDVLLRKLHAAEQYGVDTIISATADNPFVDPMYVDLLADYHNEQGNDFTKVDGLPWGVFSYALSTEAVRRACEIKAARDTEVWGGYFTQTGLFRTGQLFVEDRSVRRPELRLTVDTPEDFALINRIFDGLYRPGHVFPLRSIVAYLDLYPALKEINANIIQKAAKPIELKPGVQVRAA